MLIRDATTQHKPLVCKSCFEAVEEKVIIFGQEDAKLPTNLRMFTFSTNQMYLFLKWVS